MATKRLLDCLNLPGDLKKLKPEQQKLVCADIRSLLVRTVSENGGHLASNLGIVELTVALHTVFDLPQDQIVWDVGHQCYPHKILTGRLDRFDTIRSRDGISGFPRSHESDYDAFLGGHASTSLSAACGLAKAKTITGDNHHVIAVVGDGALTGGMIYEGLNNAGRSGDRLIMVVNDNNMSISPNVGSLARYLAAKRVSNSYLSLKSSVESALLKIPKVGEEVRDALSNTKATFRQMLLHSNLFEDFGFEYFGPVDGHDLTLLIDVLRRAKAQNCPVVVHVNTVKGKGYSFAEKNPSRFHGVGRFDSVSGELPPSGKSFSGYFGKRLMAHAKLDKRICAITAAMQTGTGLQAFAEKYAPQNRFFDVGIAEEHALTFACGLAAGGMKPVFAVYSTFLQRAFDQLLHDAAIEPRHIVVAVDRAGLVGEDGETHQGLFDAAFLSQVPGIIVYSPATFSQFDYAFDQALHFHEGPVAVRYPRGGEAELDFVPTGDYTHIADGGHTLIISYGRISEQVDKARLLLASVNKTADLLLLDRITPIPQECVLLAKKYRSILFVEEGVRTGGIGEHFIEALTNAEYRGKVKLLAIDQPFVPQMPTEQAIEFCGLDAQSIAQIAEDLFF